MPGSIIVSYLMSTAVASFTFAMTAAAFAINMVASAIISKAFAPKPYGNNDQTANPGSPTQLAPAGSNKVPVIYGTAYTGGIVTDLSITGNNQRLYYVMTLAEVTNTAPGQTADAITFGNVYWGGKRCVFGTGADTYKVVGLYDESTGVTDTTVDSKLNIYLYNNGSNAPTNSTSSAITVMSSFDLAYQWDATKLMTNTAFAIIEITYSISANLTGIQQTRFQITNSRFKPGECLSDYLLSPRYGAAFEAASIDTASLAALDAYCNATMTYTPYTGGSATQTRFRFDGVVDTSQTIMTTMQMMAANCDCLIRFNEITGQWGVIVQSPAYTLAMAINDSNMTSAIQITPTDLSSSYNIAEVKFPDGTQKDSFNTVTLDLSIVNPGLMYPNEPVNKQTINLPLVNNSVRAQYLANRFLEEAREDLQIMVNINYSGIQLEAGDIVSVTNTNYGWSAKLFRIAKVVEQFADSGAVTAALTLMEYNPAVYDDVNVTQFTPAPNTGIGSPLGFGTLTAPTITNVQVGANIPSFGLSVTASSNGIVQYAEVYYSAFSAPTNSQRIFLGTTAVQPGGNPYNPGGSMGVVTVTNIPQGDWYFAVRMVNALGSSNFSASSAVFAWRPLTFQFDERYLAVAYADNATGTSGFSFDPRNKSYFGLYNNSTANGGTNPTIYNWYSATNFGSFNYLLYANRTNRKFSFNVGFAGYVNLGGAFVPTDTAIYDTSVWSGLVDPIVGLQSFIDLDARTGQTIVAGGTSNNFNDGFLSVTNNTDGTMRVNLQDFLNFGTNIYTKTFSAATLTIDIYGRVVGFEEQDQFFYTETVYTATAGQTSFSNTHTVGWILVFRNGVLLDPSEYTETSTTVVMANACAVGETVIIFYMRGVSTAAFYENLNIAIASSTSNSITYSNNPYQIINAGDLLSFTNTGSPTTYTVSTVNTTTKVITFTTTIAGATALNTVYRYRAAGSNYAPFSRYDQDVSGVTTFTATTYAIQNGAECIYVNGSQINEIDYDINGNAIEGFPAPVTGKLTVLMYAPNNLGVPASNISNTTAYSTAGQTTYAFTSNPLSLEIYANGALLTQGAGKDYTASTANYILTTAFNNNLTLLNQQTFARDGAA
jgi:hypothetical protein